MEYRDLKKQYDALQEEINDSIFRVIKNANYISGKQVAELEHELEDYVGVKHCITCANGTDALLIALRAWNIGVNDAVFVPDFTFFSTGEVVADAGATPVFVDIDRDTFNMSPQSLEHSIKGVMEEGMLVPKAIIPVDLFGQPADYESIQSIAKKYNLKILEDGAQGFGGEIGEKKACSFGDISTTSFFPAKPLGCYGDGGAIFTNDDEAADLIRSLCIHGKGKNKYDNVRIGMNSRLDTMQAAILLVKLKAFRNYELNDINEVADRYTKMLSDIVKTPIVKAGYLSSWAQYTICMEDKEMRDGLQKYLKTQNIPSMIYYPKPMHLQTAFENIKCLYDEMPVTSYICDRVLSLPMHPYLGFEEQEEIANEIKRYLK